MKCVIAIILDTPKIIDRASPRKTAARPSNLILKKIVQKLIITKKLTNTIQFLWPHHCHNHLLNLDKAG